MKTLQRECDHKVKILNTTLNIFCDIILFILSVAEGGPYHFTAKSKMTLNKKKKKIGNVIPDKKPRSGVALAIRPNKRLNFLFGVS